MNPEHYTSLELSKKLHEAGCEFESEYRHVKYGEDGYGRIGFIREGDEIPDFLGECEHYPAYSYYDILVTYAKEMFGEECVCAFTGTKGGISECDPWHSTNCCCDNYIDEMNEYEYHTRTILDLLQQGKKEEAEKYIWEHCVFFNK